MALDERSASDGGDKDVHAYTITELTRQNTRERCGQRRRTFQHLGERIDGRVVDIDNRAALLGELGVLLGLLGGLVVLLVGARLLGLTQNRHLVVAVRQEALSVVQTTRSD